MKLFEKYERCLDMEYYYKGKNFWLINGDCLKILANIPENSIDMVFADPPYMLSNGGFTCQSGHAVSVNKGYWDKSKGVEADFKFHKNWIAACKRILKPEGTLWVSGTYHSIFQCGFAIQQLGFKILNDIAWYKPNASPNLSCRYFTASHESLIWAKKDPCVKHVFNYDAMRGEDFPEDFLKKPGKQMRSVWAINTPAHVEKIYGKHPTQKPLNLLKRIIEASTTPKALILDPFAGSSTTGIAAITTGRKFIGIDICKDYLDLSVKRYEDLKK